MAATDPDPRNAPPGFGTFGGVFTPCTLTILGVIMFLRFGSVVGAAGILAALGIVVLSKAITTLTALSLAAVATNTRVRGGGAYYLISRSLGVEFGGSIGVVFFLAQAVSVAMYVFGFTEAFLGAFPGLGLDPTALASLVNVLVFLCVYIGAGWTIRLQYGILAVLVLALVSFYLGAFRTVSSLHFEANLGPGYPEGRSFFTAFALFFPAATGIMAGANMSGDLRDPARSIPRGTLLSIAVTAVIYLSMGVVLGSATDRETLLGNSLVVEDLSISPLLVMLGIFAATLSSALGSMMGAPRILQALARDRVYPALRAFGRGSGLRGEPRRATILSFAISQVCILFADLDGIAPIITMFFMITYGYLNLATFYEAITKNPSYRPAFRASHWSTALLGAVGCAVVMVLVSWAWALAAVAAMALLHWYTARREVVTTWGDLKSGRAFERARLDLLRLEDEKYHPKNWRPSFLVLTGPAGERDHLTVFGWWLTGGRGVLTLAQIIKGEVDSHVARRASQEKILRNHIREHELPAFPVVLVAPSVPTGVEALVQCYGIGALRPNVVMTGWSSDPSRMDEFGAMLRTVAALGRSIVMARLQRGDDDPWRRPWGTVDVWWRGRDNGPLMLLMAWLLVQSTPWRGTTIRVIRAINSEAGREEARKHLEGLITQARIRAVAEVFVAEEERPDIPEISRRAAATFIGFQPPEDGEETALLERLNALVGDLHTVIAVCSAGGVALEA